MHRFVTPLVMLFCFQVAQAEELWIRSRRFSGVQVGQQNDLYVGSEDFCKAMELKWFRSGRVLHLGKRPAEEMEEPSAASISEVRIGEKTIPFQQAESGQVLIHLRSAAEALGASMTKNASLGTLDVQFSSRARKALEEEPGVETPPVESTPQAHHPAPNESRPSRLPSPQSGKDLVAVLDKRTNLWGYKRPESSEWVILPKFARAFSFSFGLAPAVSVAKSATKNRYIIVGGTGKESAQERFEGLDEKEKETYRKGRYREVTSGKYGFIDSTGNWVIEPIYDSAMPFQLLERDNRVFAPVRQGNDHFSIDLRGRRLDPQK